nr:hypothetical protein [Tanacetum cinerariifolium]
MVVSTRNSNPSTSNGTSLILDDETKMFLAKKIAGVMENSLADIQRSMANMANDITALSLQNNQVLNRGPQLNHGRMPKIEFLNFSGDDVKGWVFRKYFLELLQEFGMLACKPISTPMETNHVMAHLPTEKEPPLDQCKGLRYSSCIQNDTSSGKVVGFSDADWAKCLVTKKSVSGYCIFFNNCFISWKSKKQATLSKSSTESEYRAMGSSTCEIRWIIKILNDFKIKVTLPVSLYCDNESAIQIANNPDFHERTKHFEIDVHFIREKIAKGVFWN